MTPRPQQRPEHLQIRERKYLKSLSSLGISKLDRQRKPSKASPIAGVTHSCHISTRDYIPFKVEARDSETCCEGRQKVVTLGGGSTCVRTHAQGNRMCTYVCACLCARVFLCERAGAGYVGGYSWGQRVSVIGIPRRGDTRCRIKSEIQG